MKEAYLIVSNVFVEKVEVRQEDGEFSIVCRPGTWGGYRVRTKRLYDSKAEAERQLPYRKRTESIEEPVMQRGFRSPYAYGYH